MKISLKQSRQVILQDQIKAGNFLYQSLCSNPKKLTLKDNG
jgi:hypothetical protein